MNFRITVTFSLLLLALSTVGRAENAEETYGMKNGRFWNTLPDSERALLLVGIDNGWELRGQTEEATQAGVLRAFNPCASSVTYGEEAEMITKAYQEPENRNLPIGWVMMADEQIRCGKEGINKTV